MKENDSSQEQPHERLPNLSTDDNAAGDFGSHGCGQQDHLSTTPHEPLPTISGYRLTRLVGRGAMGRVYKAIQESTGKAVAIKIPSGDCDEGRWKMVQTEIRVLAALDHPNIMTIHDAGRTALGQPFLVMEYLSEALPLDRFVASRQYSIRQRVFLCQRICEAVNTAHRKGVVHRDLKPDNILIDKSGAPRILDFGLAKISVDSSATSPGRHTLTETGVFKGTLTYASPEQIRGQTSHIDARVDIYALGIILYELLAGTLPFSIEGSRWDVQNRILNEDPIPLRSSTSRVSPALEAIIMHCLNKVPDGRYQSAGDLSNDLRRFCNNESPSVKPASVFSRFGRFLRTQAVPLAIAGVLMATTAIFIATRVQRASLMNRCAQLVVQQHFEAAFDCYDRFIDQYPSFSEASLLLEQAQDANVLKCAEIQNSQRPDRFAAAEQCYMAILSRYAECSLAEVNLANCRISKYGNEAFAVRDRDTLDVAYTRLRDAVEGHMKENDLAWNSYATILYHRENYSEAVRAAEKALRLSNNTSFYAASNLAKSLALDHQFVEALDRVEHGLTLKDERYPSWRRNNILKAASMIAMINDDLDKALEYAQQACSLKDDEDCRLVSARVHQLRGTPEDLGQALAHAIKAAQRLDHFTDPRPHRMLAQLKAHVGEYVDAAFHAKAALEGGDHPAYCRAIIALASAHLGNQAKATVNLESAIDGPQPEFSHDGIHVTCEKQVLWFDRKSELDHLVSKATRAVHSMGSDDS